MKPLENSYSLHYKRDSSVSLMENIRQCTFCLPDFLIFFRHSQSVPLFVTLWTAACQAPLSVRFCLQEYWSGLPFPPPESVPNPGTEPTSPALQKDSLPLSHQGSPLVIMVNSHWEMLSLEFSLQIATYILILNLILKLFMFLGL